jgi:hypothetical protein
MQRPKIRLDTMPATLAQAHEALLKVRPSSNAPLTAWRLFRELAARVYTEVADIDRFHHHEALAWAGWERNKADGLRRRMKLANKDQTAAE